MGLAVDLVRRHILGPILEQCTALTWQPQDANDFLGHIAVVVGTVMGLKQKRHVKMNVEEVQVYIRTGYHIYESYII